MTGGQVQPLSVKPSYAQSHSGNIIRHPPTPTSSSPHVRYLHVSNADDGYADGGTLFDRFQAHQLQQTRNSLSGSETSESRISGDEYGLQRPRAGMNPSLTDSDSVAFAAASHDVSRYPSRPAGKTLFDNFMTERDDRHSLAHSSEDMETLSNAHPTPPVPARAPQKKYIPQWAPPPVEDRSLPSSTSEASHGTYGARVGGRLSESSSSFQENEPIAPVEVQYGKSKKLFDQYDPIPNNDSLSRGSSVSPEPTYQKKQSEVSPLRARRIVKYADPPPYEQRSLSSDTHTGTETDYKSAPPYNNPGDLSDTSSDVAEDYYRARQLSQGVPKGRSLFDSLLPPPADKDSLAHSDSVSTSPQPEPGANVTYHPSGVEVKIATFVKEGHTEGNRRYDANRYASNSTRKGWGVSYTSMNVDERSLSASTSHLESQESEASDKDYRVTAVQSYNNPYELSDDSSSSKFGSAGGTKRPPHGDKEQRASSRLFDVLMRGTSDKDSLDRHSLTDVHGQSLRGEERPSPTEAPVNINTREPILLARKFPDFDKYRRLDPGAPDSLPDTESYTTTFQAPRRASPVGASDTLTTATAPTEAAARGPPEGWLGSAARPHTLFDAMGFTGSVSDRFSETSSVTGIPAGADRYSPPPPEEGPSRRTYKPKFAPQPKVVPPSLSGSSDTASEYGVAPLRVDEGRTISTVSTFGDFDNSRSVPRAPGPKGQLSTPKTLGIPFGKFYQDEDSMSSTTVEDEKALYGVGDDNHSISTETTEPSDRPRVTYQPAPGPAVTLLPSKGYNSADGLFKAFQSNYNDDEETLSSASSRSQLAPPSRPAPKVADALRTEPKRKLSIQRYDTAGHTPPRPQPHQSSVGTLSDSDSSSDDQIYPTRVAEPQQTGKPRREVKYATMRPSEGRPESIPDSEDSAAHVYPQPQDDNDESLTTYSDSSLRQHDETTVRKPPARNGPEAHELHGARYVTYNPVPSLPDTDDTPSLPRQAQSAQQTAEPAKPHPLTKPRIALVAQPAFAPYQEGSLPDSDSEVSSQSASLPTRDERVDAKVASRPPLARAPPQTRTTQGGRFGLHVAEEPSLPDSETVPSRGRESMGSLSSTQDSKSQQQAAPVRRAPRVTDTISGMSPGPGGRYGRFPTPSIGSLSSSEPSESGGREGGQYYDMNGSITTDSTATEFDEKEPPISSLKPRSLRQNAPPVKPVDLFQAMMYVPGDNFSLPDSESAVSQISDRPDMKAAHVPISIAAPSQMRVRQAYAPMKTNFFDQMAMVRDGVESENPLDFESVSSESNVLGSGAGRWEGELSTRSSASPSFNSSPRRKVAAVVAPKRGASGKAPGMFEAMLLYRQTDDHSLTDADSEASVEIAPQEPVAKPSRSQVDVQRRPHVRVVRPVAAESPYPESLPETTESDVVVRHHRNLEDVMGMEVPSWGSLTTESDYMFDVEEGSEAPRLAISRRHGVCSGGSGVGSLFGLGTKRPLGVPYDDYKNLDIQGGSIPDSDSERSAREHSLVNGHSQGPGKERRRVQLQQAHGEPRYVEFDDRDSLLDEESVESNDDRGIDMYSEDASPRPVEKPAAPHKGQSSLSPFVTQGLMQYSRGLNGVPKRAFREGLGSVFSAGSDDLDFHEEEEDTTAAPPPSERGDPLETPRIDGLPPSPPAPRTETVKTPVLHAREAPVILERGASLYRGIQKIAYESTLSEMGEDDDKTALKEDSSVMYESDDPESPRRRPGGEKPVVMNKPQERHVLVRRRLGHPMYGENPKDETDLDSDEEVPAPASASVREDRPIAAVFTDLGEKSISKKLTRFSIRTETPEPAIEPSDDGEHEEEEEEVEEEEEEKAVASFIVKSAQANQPPSTGSLTSTNLASKKEQSAAPLKEEKGKVNSLSGSQKSRTTTKASEDSRNEFVQKWVSQHSGHAKVVKKDNLFEAIPSVSAFINTKRTTGRIDNWKEVAADAGMFEVQEWDSTEDTETYASWSPTHSEARPPVTVITALTAFTSGKGERDKVHQFKKRMQRWRTDTTPHTTTAPDKYEVESS